MVGTGKSGICGQGGRPAPSRKLGRCSGAATQPGVALRGCGGSAVGGGGPPVLRHSAPVAGPGRRDGGPQDCRMLVAGLAERMEPGREATLDVYTHFFDEGRC